MPSSDEDVARALAAQLDVPFAARIGSEQVDVELARAVPINFAKQSRLLPLRREEGAVVVAVADPLDTSALDHARMLLGAPLRPVVASAGAIVDAINAAYDRALNEAEQLVGEMEAQDDLDSLAHELEEPQDLLEADDEAPIIRWSTRCSSRRPRSGPATSTSSRWSASSSSASASTACCTRSSGRRSATRTPSSAASR